MITTKDEAWERILDRGDFRNHNFNESPFFITAKEIKTVTSGFNISDNSLTEPRILCKQDTRESCPRIFRDNGLFILPVKNGKYAILRGDGYVDIPTITTQPISYSSQLGFDLETSLIGNSEMQYLDKAYASSIIRTFMSDTSLVLTIRGRKYTPEFDFYVGNQELHVKSVQTEVDAGYEGRNEIVLVEAKNTDATNTIIRQLYYPFRQWQLHTHKPVKTLFFEHCLETDLYNIWEFSFANLDDYTSIRFERSARFRMT